jgi:hypothetical protein
MLPLEAGGFWVVGPMAEAGVVLPLEAGGQVGAASQKMELANNPVSAVDQPDMMIDTLCDHCVLQLRLRLGHRQLGGCPGDIRCWVLLLTSLA